MASSNSRLITGLPWALGVLVASSVISAAPQSKPLLRAPWPERSSDLGTLSGGVRVQSDLRVPESRRWAARVSETRRALASVFEGIPLQKPEAPWLLLFQDPRELAFVVRTNYGVPCDDELAVFFEAPFLNHQVVALSGVHPSNYGGDRAAQRAAFHQYAFPRFASALPQWAWIGLAEYASLFQVDSNGGVSGGYVPPEFVVALQKADARERLIPVERLLQLDEDSWAEFEATHGRERLIAQAWAFVQFMLHGRSGAFVQPFLDWLHQVANRRDPTQSLFEVLQLRPGKDGFGELESAFRAYHRSLEPSQVIQFRECIELMRTTLEVLEEESIRPTSVERLKAAIESIGPQEVLLFERPYVRTMQSRSWPLCSNIKTSFHPTRLRDSVLRKFPSPPPMDVEFSDEAGNSARISWRFLEAENRWIPTILY